MRRPGKLGETDARIAVLALAVFAAACAMVLPQQGSTRGALVAGAIALALGGLGLVASTRTMEEIGSWLSFWG